MKYIDADLLRRDIDNWKEAMADAVGEYSDGVRFALEHFTFILDSLQQEQPNKESLNENQQEFVNIVTERMLKEGPIPTLKGKQKAKFEKEFNRFKQITGMINFPAQMEVYKKIILWFMAWSADNLPNLNKVTDPDELDFQQEQPEADLEKELEQYARNHPADDAGSYRNLIGIARHFYELGKNHK